MPKVRDKKNNNLMDAVTHKFSLEKRDRTCTDVRKPKNKCNNAKLSPVIKPIQKSLQKKMHTSTPRRLQNSKKSQMKLCNNRSERNMPSLSELKKYYENSDTEDMDTEPVNKSDVNSEVTASTVVGNDFMEKFDSCLTKIISTTCRVGSVSMFANNNNEMEQETPPKRTKLSHSPIPNNPVLSNKIEKVTNVKDVVETQSSGSNDSDETVLYNLRPISPIPKHQRDEYIASTSTDIETFLLNDDIFEKKLKDIERKNKSSFNGQLSLMSYDIPCETILQERDCIIPCNTILQKGDHITGDNTNKELEEVHIPPSPELDEYYQFDKPLTVDTCEIIDIDEQLAQNRSFFEKHKNICSLNKLKSATDSNCEQVQANIEEIIDLDCDEYENFDTHNFSESPIIIEVDQEPQIPLVDLVNPVINLSTPDSSFRPNIEIPFDDSVIFISESYTTPKENPQNKDNNEVESARLVMNNNTPEKVNQEPKNISRDCPICMDNLSTTEVASTICGHIFCMKCIKQAMKYEKKCPACRRSLGGKNGYHPLFL